MKLTSGEGVGAEDEDSPGEVPWLAYKISCGSQEPENWTSSCRIHKHTKEMKIN